MGTRPFAAAASRNAQPILEVLEHELAGRERIFEIGAGTGQHAVYFAGHLPSLDWQASDVEQNLPGIRAWFDEATLDNLRRPVPFDVLDNSLPAEGYEAVFSANTAHIMSFDAVEAMFAACAELLVDGGVFCLYGPFRLGGEHTTESNAAFDRSLRSRNSQMGLRDIDELRPMAGRFALTLRRCYAMPSNNLLLVWAKAGERQR